MIPTDTFKYVVLTLPGLTSLIAFSWVGIFLTAKPLWVPDVAKNALINIYDYQRMGPRAQLLFRVQLRRGDVTFA